MQDVMTVCPHAIGDDQNLTLAKEMFHKYKVRHLPVQSRGHIVGVITERDIQFLASLEKDVDKWKVKDALTPEPYVVEPDEDLLNVASKMYQDKIGCAIVSAGQKLVGIFTTTDACRVLSEVLE